jgi:hypothetical protein
LLPNRSAGEVFLLLIRVDPEGERREQAPPQPYLTGFKPRDRGARYRRATGKRAGGQPGDRPQLADSAPAADRGLLRITRVREGGIVPSLFADAITIG